MLRALRQWRRRQSGSVVSHRQCDFEGLDGRTDPVAHRPWLTDASAAECRASTAGSRQWPPAAATDPLHQFDMHAKHGGWSRRLRRCSSIGVRLHGLATRSLPWRAYEALTDWPYWCSGCERLPLIFDDRAASKGGRLAIPQMGFFVPDRSRF